MAQFLCPLVKHTQLKVSPRNQLLQKQKEVQIASSLLRAVYEMLTGLTDSATLKSQFETCFDLSTKIFVDGQKKELCDLLNMIEKWDVKHRVKIGSTRCYLPTMFRTMFRNQLVGILEHDLDYFFFVCLREFQQNMHEKMEGPKFRIILKGTYMDSNGVIQKFSQHITQTALPADIKQIMSLELELPRRLRGKLLLLDGYRPHDPAFEYNPDLM